MDRWHYAIGMTASWFHPDTHETYLRGILYEPVAVLLICSESKTPGKLRSMSKKAWYLKAVTFLHDKLDIVDHKMLLVHTVEIMNHPLIEEHSQWTTEKLTKNVVPIHDVIKDVLRHAENTKDV